MSKKALVIILIIIVIIYAITNTSRPDGSVVWIELSDTMSKLEKNIIAHSNSKGSLKYENSFLDKSNLPESCYIQYLCSISEDKAIITIEPAKVPYGRGRQILVGLIEKESGKYKAGITEKINWDELQSLFGKEFWQVIQEQTEKTEE